MFVTTVGTAGNVKPKFTIAVEAFNDVNDISTEPRRVQLVRLVILVWFVLMLACSAAISLAWSVTTLERDDNAESTWTARTGIVEVGPPVSVVPGRDVGDS
jgi:hypothetical protein